MPLSWNQIKSRAPAPLPPAGEGSKRPSPIDEKGAALRARIETAARAQFPDATLDDLYDPLSMPPVLLKTHQALDKAVDAAYGKTRFNNEAERVAFLFDRYLLYTQRQAASQPTRKKPAKKSSVPTT